MSAPAVALILARSYLGLRLCSFEHLGQLRGHVAVVVGRDGRVPRGFAPDHPAARWLRFKSFTVGRELPETEVLTPDLADRLVADYERLAPLVRWLNAALGFAPAAAR